MSRSAAANLIFAVMVIVGLAITSVSDLFLHVGGPQVAVGWILAAVGAAGLIVPAWLRARRRRRAAEAAATQAAAVAPQPDPEHDELNPEQYERVRCEECRGTGHRMSGAGLHIVKGWPSPCGYCDGKGWLLVRREDAAPRDAAAGGEARDWAPDPQPEAAAGGPPGPDDIPAAPAAPRPPDGLGGS